MAYSLRAPIEQISLYSLDSGQVSVLLFPFLLPMGGLGEIWARKHYCAHPTQPGTQRETATKDIDNRRLDLQRFVICTQYYRQLHSRFI